jgi:hypothetical protein
LLLASLDFISQCDGHIVRQVHFHSYEV